MIVRIVLLLENASSIAGRLICEFFIIFNVAVMLYQYHLQIVPTNLRLMSRDEPLALSQYSVYERKIEVSLGVSCGLSANANLTVSPCGIYSVCREIALF